MASKYKEKRMYTSRVGKPKRIKRRDHPAEIWRACRKKFAWTEQEAKEQARKLNELANRTYKVGVYKCYYCPKYHVGRRKLAGEGKVPYHSDRIFFEFEFEVGKRAADALFVENDLPFVNKLGYIRGNIERATSEG